MPRGGKLEVGTELGAEEDSVRIRVRDTGFGISLDVLPRIFEPFFTTKEDPGRTGLGLAVARSIVEAHGGSIAVRSRPGEGTEFTITIPLDGAGIASTIPEPVVQSEQERR
jgi:signal transduction histidine kinase